MKMIKDIKVILQNQKGVALIMIMTAIIFLLAIYSEFTFESKISRIKTTNILDKAQAKLMAESGLQMAMTRLKLYVEAHNKVQGNENAKGAVSPQLINQLWEVPFMYPIPVPPNSGAAFAATVADFEKESILEGEMRVTIQSISNRINLNQLRMSYLTFNPEVDSEKISTPLDTSQTAIHDDVSIDQSLYYMLRTLVDRKSDTDEVFAEKYSRVNYQELISSLKYYISDQGILAQDPFAAQASAGFQQNNITPKYGPLSSSSEIYAIPGWDDELVELIKNEFSFYPTNQIDLNKVTGNMLKLLFPNLMEDDIKEFFEYKNDPVRPRYFNSPEDLKQYFVNTARNLSEEYFNQRIEMFTKQGMTFSSNPNLFRIVSEGIYNRANYTLVAIVSVSNTTTNTSPTPNDPNNPNNQNPNQAGNNQNQNPNNQSGNQGNNATTDTNKNTQLLEPRIIEIQVN
ncbi:MAG TPA: hypothetical protein VKZ84_02405 [Bacteriovoracaceae bacterium]|nr:hypothetical protein [Bacteriovoracaceae bacterium]